MNMLVLFKLIVSEIDNVNQFFTRIVCYTYYYTIFICFLMAMLFFLM